MIWFYLFHACWAEAELWAYFTDWSGYTFKSQKGHTIEQPSSQGRILVKCLWKKTTFAEGQEPFGMAENLNLWGSVHPNSLHQPRASEAAHLRSLPNSIFQFRIPDLFAFRVRGFGPGRPGRPRLPIRPIFRIFRAQNVHAPELAMVLVRRLLQFSFSGKRRRFGLLL